MSSLDGASHRERRALTRQPGRRTSHLREPVPEDLPSVGSGGGLTSVFLSTKALMREAHFTKTLTIVTSYLQRVRCL